MIKNEYIELMTSLFEGVYIVDSNRKIIFWNTGSENITGYKSEEVVNKHCYSNILQHVDKNGKELCFGGCPLHETLATGKEMETDVFLHHKEGHRVPVTVRSFPIYDKKREKVVAAVEVFTDNRFRKDNYYENKRLQELILVDDLTKIYNRRYLDFQLKTYIQEAVEFNQKFGVLFIDIDKFKNVNDKYGHDVGDKILQLISRTVNSNIRANDIFGRWGGEEFLLLAKVASIDELELVAEKLRLLVEKSYHYLDNNEPLNVTVSSGGSIYQAEDTEEIIIKRADVNMYKAKDAGRNRIIIT